MTINIQPANLYKPGASRQFMKSMASNGLARFILLEACVEAGRTYYAFKRGGFDEGRERFTEEFLGAVFWLGGVKAFNKMNDAIGKRILKFSTTDFDIGSDKARDTIKNFIYKEINPKTGAKYTESQIAAFKATKLIASILMANAMIGFVVPKMNQAITRRRHRNDNVNQDIVDINKNNNQDYSNGLLDFIEKSKDKKGKDVPFGNALMKVAFNLENNTTWQLLSTDVGTTTGRAISARNGHERREIIFRDVASIIFYMWSMPFINRILNKIEQKGRGNRIDSMNADYTTDLMKQIVKEKGGTISPDDFKSVMTGQDYTLPQSVKDAFNKGYMDLNEFKKKLPEILGDRSVDIRRYENLAEAMSELQPAVEGKARITLEQAEKMFKGGYLNDPEFLKNLYEIAFGKKSKLPNFLNPYKFISSRDVEGVDDDVKYYVEQIIEKAKKSGKQITEKMLDKAAKKNFRFNVLNWGTGFVVSAIFLSSIIPKMQYWMTKRITGNNDFPGTAEFRHNDEEAKQARA